MKKLLACVAATALAVFVANCGGGGDGGQCSGPQDCPQGQYCDLTTKTCKTQCNPDCTGKCGGDDGCGGTCPNTCPAGQTCNTDTNQCEACQPDCTGRDCGPDPNCGEICGACDTGEICNDGVCETCTKDCTGLECGPDPVCGESCGTCDTNEHCENGICVTGASVPGDPCPNGDADCPAEWPTCLEGSGFTYCSKVCTTDTDCGGQNCCLDISGGQKACFDPTQCPGSGQLGDPCPFSGGVHQNAVNCDGDHQCLGIDPTASNATDCSVADDCGIDSAWNPECVNGKCGASFCSLPCPGGSGDNCPQGSMSQSISGQCFCIPSPVDQNCSDPVNNDCPAGEKCDPLGGSALDCVPDGTVQQGGACGEGIGDCAAGNICVGPTGGPYTCEKICDTEGDGSDCPTDYSCFGIGGIDRWGICDYTPPCDILDGENACPEPAGYACINWEWNGGGCSEFRCIFNSGAQAGASCQFVNSCAPGLVCEGDPSGTCKEACDPNADTCPTGTTCQAPAGLCTTPPSDWGVCK